MTTAYPYELSHAAWHSLSHAVDHLSCLRAAARREGGPHVRALLAGAGGAGRTRAPRSGCSSRRAGPIAWPATGRAVTDIRNGEQVKQVIGQPGPRSERERMEEVRAIAGRAGVDEAAVRRGAPYSEIIQAAGDSAGPSWKLCSGMVHGDFWPTWGAMQRVELPGAPEGTGTFQIEADVKLLMYVTAFAVNLTRQGWQLYDQRCRPPS